MRSLKIRFARQEPTRLINESFRSTQRIRPGCRLSSVSKRHMQESYDQSCAAPEISQRDFASTCVAVVSEITIDNRMRMSSA